MRLDQFFRGFLLAVRASGVDYLKTRGNEHHKRFALVVAALATTEDPELAQFARTFRPNMLGLYRELDGAVLRAQDLVLGANNPSYVGLTYKISKETADEILQKMFSQHKAAFTELAAVFNKTKKTEMPESVAA